MPADKCAHKGCTCMAGGPDRVQRDGKTYCSKACANGKGCNHPGCTCGGR